MSPHPGAWNESIVIRLPDADRVEVVGNARQAKEILCSAGRRLRQQALRTPQR